MLCEYIINTMKYNIIIPMAGLSQRFFKAGYKTPKYLLQSKKKTLMYHSLLTFKNYFKSSVFYLGFLSKYVDKEKIVEILDDLGILNYQLIDLVDETSGQADTVYKTIKFVDNTNPIVVFNIDTKINDFSLDKEKILKDGYIEVFEGDGDNWSFIKVNSNNQIIKVTEKERISNLCSNGLYVFKNKNIYANYFEKIYSDGFLVKNETYIMPIYQKMIDDYCDIDYKIIDKKNIDFFGTPAEYEQFK